MRKTLFLLFALLCFSFVDAQNFQPQSDLQWLAVPNHSDWLYRSGEQASIDVRLLWHGMPLPDGTEIEYRICGDVIDATKVNADGKPRKAMLRDGQATLRLGTLKESGFVDCRMSATIDGKTYKNHLKVGFDPERLKPYTQLPSDFETFWTGVLQEARSLPLKTEVKAAPEYSDEQVECFLVKIQAGLKGIPHAIYGYLSIPRKEGRFPIVISPPGAGVKPMNPQKTQFYASQGDMIRLELEIHGIDPSLSVEIYRDLTRAFGDHHGNGYLANGIQSRETYYMKKVYASLLRAVDYAVTLDRWDGEHLFVQGNSQGGALALVMAALDERIDGIAIAHPALSDMAGYAEPLRTGGYPHFGQHYKEVSLTPDVIRTLSYFDAVNFARLVRCPVYLTWGYNDNTCPPTTSWIIWNVLQCPKEKYITPINEHWISTDTRFRQMNFLRTLVR